MQQPINNNDFSFIHVRPGLDDKKEHPLATIAIHLVSIDGRYGVALASQHLKKDEKWNAGMGRFVAAGRAARSKDRLFIVAPNGGSRRDLILDAVQRVYDAIQYKEINASRKVARAVSDTLIRLNMAKALNDFDNSVKRTDAYRSAAAE